MVIKVVKTLEQLTIAKAIVESEWPWDGVLHKKDDILANELLNNSNVFICLGYLAGVPVCTGTLYLIPTFRCGYVKFGQIENVVTLPQYRGKGYGEQLVKYIEQMSRIAGAYKTLLVCIDERVSFYNRCGFVQNGNSMRKD